MISISDKVMTYSRVKQLVLGEDDKLLEIVLTTCIVVGVDPNLRFLSEKIP